MEINTISKEENFLKAIKEENLEEVKTIISTGIEIDLKDEDNWTPLMHACEKNKKTEIVSLLLESGANINQKGIHGYSPLLIVCEYNLSPEILKILIKNKPNINTQDNYGWTALIHASQYTNKEIVEILLTNNIDVEKKNNNEWNALMFAEETRRDSEIVHLIKVFGIRDVRERIIFVIKHKCALLFEKVFRDYKEVYENGWMDIMHLYVIYGGDDEALLGKMGIDLAEKDSYGWDFGRYKEWRKRRGNVKYLLIFG